MSEKFFQFMAKARGHAPQFGLYILSGGTAAVVDVGTYTLLVHLGTWYITANIVSSILGFFTAFLGHKYFVFRKQNQFLRHLGRYFLADMVNIALVSFLLYLFVESGLLGKEIAKIVSMGIVMFWNFFVHKFFVYV